MNTYTLNSDQMDLNPQVIHIHRSDVSYSNEIEALSNFQALKILLSR